eukprot:m.101671 g.101671  ORF g.101671 m.101671 type:complete len:698 (+) comp13751_c0_seq2:108-2201(+)
MESYEKIRTVGRGAYGVVVLCRRLSDNSLVIIKEIPVEEMTTEERQAALNEVKVLDMLNHPNIIAYHDSFVQDKALMIVMEYAEGGTIFEYLQARHGELLPEKDIMSLFVQMVISIQAIHSHNILHRDLKTQNIMLDRKQKIVKIGDFGISKVLSSKSKANTVVGTPCYISPELCEGKPYNQKSDIWALGCVLYEMVSLRRAFDAANLPALVLKIMRGTFAPVSDSYSEDLRKLILSTLHLDPRQRPRPSEILALPICQNALLDLYTDIGRLPCVVYDQSPMRSRSDSNASFASRSGSGGLSARSVARAQPRDYHGSGRGILWMWGTGLTYPIPLDGLENEIVGAALSRTHCVAVSKEGTVVSWKIPRIRHENTPNQDPPSPAIQRFPGLQSVVVRRVACGISFTACLTDRNILMTFGNGANGCLGHNDYEDCDQPRIVEALLSTEVHHISAGSNHIIATTMTDTVYGWGCGDHGCLGLGNTDTHCAPQKINIGDDTKIFSSCCGDDCTMFISESGKGYACGSNRQNKIGLYTMDHEQGPGDSREMLSAQEAHVPMPVQLPGLGQIIKVAMGSAHTVFLTTNGVHTLGSNSHGQLGRTEGASTFVKSLEGKTIVDISSGDHFTLAVTRDQELLGWGNETGGRLGTAATQTRNEPQLIRLPTNRRQSPQTKLSYTFKFLASRFGSSVAGTVFTKEGET